MKIEITMHDNCEYITKIINKMVEFGFISYSTVDSERYCATVSTHYVKESEPSRYMHEFDLDRNNPNLSEMVAYIVKIAREGREYYK